MSLFGSYARGEATDESDVDLLINNGEIKGLIDFVDFIHELEIFKMYYGQEKLTSVKLLKIFCKVEWLMVRV